MVFYFRNGLKKIRVVEKKNLLLEPTIITIKEDWERRDIEYVISIHLKH